MYSALTLSARLCAAPLLASAILLLATSRTWRTQRSYVEAIGLGAGELILALALGGLPPVVFLALLPSASIAVALLVLAASEWQFAPDCGQTGALWALHAAVRPTLGAALGAAAGFWPILFFSHHPLFALVCPLVISAGLIVAHAFDRAFNAPSTKAPTRGPSADDEGGQPRLQPELLLS